MVSSKIVTTLTEILNEKRDQLAARKKKTPIDAVRALASMQNRPVPLLSTVTRNEPVMLIGQIKYVPLAGDTAEQIDPVAEAVRYVRAGLDAVGLFTDESIYNGGVDDLMFVARAVQSFNVPVIAQDYIFDEYQVVEARAAGAAGLMLHACILEAAMLRSLVSSTQRNRMTAIVRVTSEEELERAVAISPQVIALGDYHPDSGQAERGLARRLRPKIPTHIRVAIDALFSIEDVIEAARLNAHAVVLGGPLLRKDQLDTLRAMTHSPIV